MLLAAAREAIVTTCLELYRAGLVVGTAGLGWLRSIVDGECGLIPDW